MHPFPQFFLFLTLILLVVTHRGSAGGLELNSTSTNSQKTVQKSPVPDRLLLFDYSLWLGFNNMKILLTNVLTMGGVSNRTVMIPSFLGCRNCQVPGSMCGAMAIYRPDLNGGSGDKWMLPIEYFLDLDHLKTKQKFIKSVDLLHSLGVVAKTELTVEDKNLIIDFDNLGSKLESRIPHNMSYQEAGNCSQVLGTRENGRIAVDWLENVQKNVVYDFGMKYGWTYVFEEEPREETRKLVGLKELFNEFRGNWVHLTGQAVRPAFGNSMVFSSKGSRQKYFELMSSDLRRSRLVYSAAESLKKNLWKLINLNSPTPTGQYIAIHMRRGDMIGLKWIPDRPASFFPELINDKRQKNPKLAEKFFLATDETNEALLEAYRRVGAVLCQDLWDEDFYRTFAFVLAFQDWTALVEQLICASSTHFIGTRASSFSGSVYELRKTMNLENDLSFQLK